MELTRLPEIPYDDARRLKDAGVPTVASLASTKDVHALAHRAGIDAEAVEGYRAAARAHVERLMSRAGVHGEADLVAADPHALAAATGLPVHEVEEFQRAARAATPHAEPSMAEAHPAAAEPEARTIEVQGPPPSVGDDRVVLLDGVPTARLVVSGRVLEAVPIVTGRFPEDANDALARAGPHGVFLVTGAVAATARVEGETRQDLPIFKARAEGGELRVRIKEIREKNAAPAAAPPQEPAPAKKGLFGKLLKR